MHYSGAIIRKSMLLCVLCLVLLGCTEGQKAAPLPRVGPNESPTPEEKAPDLPR
jgi:hypothetical protein